MIANTGTADNLDVPPGQALVLLVFGAKPGEETAELVTSRHTHRAPLQVPASRIAKQVGLPIDELPGKRLAVGVMSDSDADGFRWLDDPRV